MDLKNILIIGPDPEKKAAGIVTHMKNLLQYEVFDNAEVFDVGSINSKFKENKTSYREIIKRLLILRKKINKRKLEVIINISLYVPSLYKLIAILFFIGNKAGNNINIFFHGGYATEKHKTVLSILNVVLRTNKNIKGLYFLSEIQKTGFSKYIKFDNINLYNNYSDSNNIIAKIPNRKYTFLFVGRLDESKGIIEAVKAVEILRESINKEFILHIVGDGPLLSYLNSYIVNNNLEDFIKLSRHLNNNQLNIAYASADFLIFPSYQEGFPYVYIESMRAGLPIICTRAGALKRLIKDDYNGFHINMKDAFGLSEKMKFVINNKINLKLNCYNELKLYLSKSKGNEFYNELLKYNN